MKTFNIWKSLVNECGPTGPWKFMGKISIETREEALHLAPRRWGLDGRLTQPCFYEAYEGINNMAGIVV